MELGLAGGGGGADFDGEKAMSFHVLCGLEIPSFRVRFDSDAWAEMIFRSPN